MKKTLPKSSFVYKTKGVGKESNMKGDKQKPSKSMVGLRAPKQKIR